MSRVPGTGTATATATGVVGAPGPLHAGSASGEGVR